MSACMQELYALLTFSSSSSPSSLSSSRASRVSQSLVEYALHYDIQLEPAVLSFLLLLTLALLCAALGAAVYYTYRRILALPSASAAALPSSASSSSASLVSLRDENAVLKSRLTILQHASDAAQRRSQEQQQKAEEERKRQRAERKREEEREAESRREWERRLQALRKEAEAAKEESRRMADERMQEKEEAETRRREDVKLKAKSKKEEKEERERREKDDKRREEERASLQRQLEERGRELQAAERRRVEQQDNMQRLEESIVRYRQEAKDGRDREAQLKASVERLQERLAAAVVSSGAGDGSSERRKEEDDRRWSEAAAVMSQLQRQNSSLQQELEQEKERKTNAKQETASRHQEEEEQRRQQLQQRDEQIAALQAAAQKLTSELQAAADRADTLQTRCRDEQEKAAEAASEAAEKEASIVSLRAEVGQRQSQYRRELGSREAELRRQEADCSAAQERIAELSAQAKDREEQLQSWREAAQQLQSLLAGREHEVRGRLRELLGLPALSPPQTSRPQRTQPPPPISISPASAPSSPVSRRDHVTSSVPSSPSAVSLRAELDQYDVRLQDAQRLLAESPKAKAGRKEKQRMVRRAREQLFELIKRKRELQDRINKEDAADSQQQLHRILPPVPLFAEETRLSSESAVQTAEQQDKQREEELQRLREELATVQQRAAGQLSELQSQLSGQSSLNTQLQQEVKSGRQQLAAALSAHQAALASLQSQADSAQRALEEKEAQLAEAERALRSSEEAASSLSSQLQSRDAALAQLRSELQSASAALLEMQQSTVPEAEHTASVSSLQSRLASLQRHLQQLKEQLSSAQSELQAEHQSLQSLSLRTEAEIAALKADIATQLHARSALAAESEEAKAALAAGRQELQRLLERQDELFFLNRRLAEDGRKAQQDADAATLRASDTEEQLFSVLMQHQAAQQHWQDRLQAVSTSSEAAVQAAEDEAEMRRSQCGQLEDTVASLRMQAEQAARSLQLFTSQRDSARQALKAMEEACAGFMEDARLRGAEAAEARDRLELKERELMELQHLFTELQQRESLKTADEAQQEAEEQRQQEQQVSELNDSITQLETVVKQSAMRRGQSLDASRIAAGAAAITPLKQRRFVFVNVQQTAEQQTATPQREDTEQRSASSADSLQPATPIAASVSPSSSRASGDAQLPSLQSRVSELERALLQSQESLSEETRRVSDLQATIDRLRQYAKGKREGGMTALHRLRASQTRMEELNSRLTLKMRDIHRRQKSQQLAAAAAADQDGSAAAEAQHGRHSSAPAQSAAAAAPATAVDGLSVEMSALLSQLSAEHAVVVEQAAALSAMREKAEVEAAFQSSLMQRLEDSEERRRRLKRAAMRQQETWEAEKAKIEQLIELSTAELQELEDEREERERIIAQLEQDVRQWKGKADGLSQQIDAWAEAEHHHGHAAAAAAEAARGKKESKRDYLKRRWHELTYGGQRHCPSCERAAAAGGDAEAHADHHATPVKAKAKSGRRKGSRSPGRLQVPQHDDQRGQESDSPSPHHRHDSSVSIDAAAQAVDVEAVEREWKATVQKLQQAAADDEGRRLELQSLGDHLARLTSHSQQLQGQLREKEREKAEMSLSLPSFEITAGSAISLVSGGSEAGKRAESADKKAVRQQDREREREQLLRDLSRKDAELQEERRLVRATDAELQQLRSELDERRRDEEQVHSVLKQAQLRMAFHSRQPSSATSVGSAFSGASSAYSDEHKEEEAELYFDARDQAVKELQVQLVAALREIDALQQLHREDEGKIEEAVRQLRNSRQQVCRDYADMIELSQQLTQQQQEIDQLKAALDVKEQTVKRLELEAADWRRRLEELGGGGAGQSEVSGSSLLSESMIERQLAEFEARFAAQQAAMEEKDALLLAARSDCHELRELCGAQESKITQLSKAMRGRHSGRQSQQQPHTDAASQSLPAADSSAESEALRTVAQIAKEYRAEKRLREELQRAQRLSLQTPITSPSHSRQQSSVDIAVTPQRVNGGNREMLWWQREQQRRRGVASGGAAAPVSAAAVAAFSSPAAAVRSALSGAFTSSHSTPTRSPSRDSSDSVTSLP